MRRRIAVTSALLVAIAVSDALAKECEMTLRLSLNAIPALRAGRQLAFAGEELRARVTMGSFRVAGPKGSCDRDFSTPWWEVLRWQVTDVAGEPIEITPRFVHASGSTGLGVRENAQETVSFSLGQLPIGEYDIRVNGHGVAATNVVSIKRGDEDNDVRRAYLRHALRKTHDSTDQVKVLAELARLEPTNPEHPETIARLAMGQFDYATGLRHFALAIRIRESNMERWLKTHPVDSATEAAQIEQLKTLTSAIATRTAAGEQVTLEIQSLPSGRRYTLLDRQTRRVLIEVQ